MQKTIFAGRFLSRFDLSSSTREEILGYAPEEEGILRSAPFDLEEMVRHGRDISQKHVLIEGHSVADLLKDLAWYERTILETNILFSGEDRCDDLTQQCAEWRSNLDLVRDQLLKTRTLLLLVDKGLPRLQTGPNAHSPRLYNIATEFISHANSRIEPDILKSFIHSYQERSRLEILELKAVRALFKLCLINNLRRIALANAYSLIESRSADYWCDRIRSAPASPAGGNAALEELYSLLPSCSVTFLSALARQIDGEEGNWLPGIERALAKRNISINAAHRLEKKRQFGDLNSLWNCINSLQQLDNIDWQEFIDEMSVTEKILRKDCSGVYGRMDFHTRDLYRAEVAGIARQTGLTEFEVARWAVLLSKYASTDTATAHIGYFLIGPGRKKFGQSLGVHHNVKETISEFILRSPLLFYLGGLAMVTAIIGYWLLGMLYDDGARGLLLVLTGIMILLGSSNVAKYLIDLLAGFFKKPATLPKYDLSRGIPEEFTTLVVVPAMLTSPEAISELVHDLEIRFLCNRDAHLHFGLLTDFKDSTERTTPDDELLLRHAMEGIERLNEKYPSGPNGSFFLFHRPRKWNARDRIWMGFERKRGKIMELNALLRGQRGDNFSTIIGDQRHFPRIKYVITLDSDTQLPRETAWKLVATLAHPVNKAVYCARKGRVIAGYGMLQPRMATDLRGADDSLYQKLNSAGPDVDPYTRASPDVYQDLFGEGSYSGKGIYEVDTFLSVLHNRFPDNRILSHDLLEGCHVRSGLLNDVKLYERYPDYLTDISRRHRWIRGDWQIAEWVLPVVPGFGGARVKNPLSAVSRWKIFDNLRRSLLPVSLLCMLFIGDTLLRRSGVWTLYVIGVALFPSLALFLSKMLKSPGKIFVPVQWKNAAGETAGRFWLNLYELICLPYEALCAVNAIAITGWRVFISRKNLLIWTPAGSGRNAGHRSDLAAMFRRMRAAPLISLLFAGCLFFGYGQQEAIPWSIPLCLGWILSPWMVWVMYRKQAVHKESLPEPDKWLLRRLARKTWAYFEDQVNKDTNWLPPDHFQEYPFPKTAVYTSPTNLGLTLLSNLAAHDFGYITAARFIERTAGTLDSMERLQRYEGHFYNWYNIRTMEPVHPRYVSTVDSGNLIGHVMTLREGLREFFDRSVIGKNVFEGLADMVEVIRTEPALLPLGAAIRSRLARGEPDTLDQIRELIDHLDSLIAQNTVTETAAGRLVERLHRQVKDIKDDLGSLVPWLWATDIPTGIAGLISGRQEVPGLNRLEEELKAILAEMQRLQAAIPAAEQQVFGEFKANTERALLEIGRRKRSLVRMIAQCEKFTRFELDFLIKKPEHLLSIGYNVESGSLEANNYDILASESRLATFVAICKNKLPVKSWFLLGRSLLYRNGSVSLLSANGTMFEYLMAPLVMPEMENTLLHEACKTAVKMQIQHGTRLGVPWGVSESGYAKVDQSMNYQYKVFGVPELCLKHDHSENEKVIAPYATLLALTVDAAEACKNLKQLLSMGMEGQYGVFEAIDLSTPGPAEQKGTVIRSFMVHHLGMGFLAMNDLFMDKIMQRRFAANPDVETGLLLLQENLPTESIVYPYASNTSRPRAKSGINPEKKTVAIANGVTPEEVQLLSNGRYHVLVDGNGNGYSRWEDILVTQWRSEDDGMNGIFCTLADLGEPSAHFSDRAGQGHQKQNLRASFSPGCAEFWCDTGDISVHARQLVSAEDDLEIREILLLNTSKAPKIIEVSGCNDHTAGEGPGKAVMDYEVLYDQHAVLYKKRSGANKEHQPWMFHYMTIEGKEPVSLTYEPTDASRSFGHVVRYRIVIEAGRSALVRIGFGIGEQKEACLGLLKKCRRRQHFEKMLEAASRRSSGILGATRIADEDLATGRQLAGRLIPAGTVPVTPPSVLVRVVNTDCLFVLLKMIKMHTWWRLNGLVANLVIWNEDKTCHRNFSEKLIAMLLSRGGGSEVLNYHSGGIFVGSPEAEQGTEHVFLSTIAAVITIEHEESLENAVASSSNVEELAITYES